MMGNKLSYEKKDTFMECGYMCISRHGDQEGCIDGLELMRLHIVINIETMFCLMRKLFIVGGV